MLPADPRPARARMGRRAKLSLNTVGRTATLLGSPLLRRTSWLRRRLTCSSRREDPESGRPNRQPAVSRLSRRSSATRSWLVSRQASRGRVGTSLGWPSSSKTWRPSRCSSSKRQCRTSPEPLSSMTTPCGTPQKAAEAAARSLGLMTQVIGIRDERDLEGAFRSAKAGRANAMYVLPSSTFSRHRARLAELAVKHRLPGIYEDRQYVDAGGLMSYGPNFPDLFAVRQAMWIGFSRVLSLATYRSSSRRSSSL